MRAAPLPRAASASGARAGGPMHFIQIGMQRCHTAVSALFFERYGIFSNHYD